MAQKKLENMDEDEFLDAWTKAADELQAAKDRVKEFSAEQERRQAEAAAAEVLDNMNDSQLAVLAQAIEARGIESEEGVNNG